WPNQDPVGKRMRREGKQNEVYEVVGLARNSKYFFIAESPIAAVYFATAQHDDSNLYLFLHTDRDPAAMADALATYAASPALRAAHGAAGRARIEAQFSLEAMVARYAGVYERALAG
ncbi:MAG: hypothetical protein JNL44_18590, partial [Gemmatimonadetes bacterium]|nr:hypothetical protein [Gemmatimonadota bacterium]